MCSCDQNLVTLVFLWKKFSQPQFYKDLTRKTTFFEGWSCVKFNNLGLALGTNLKFYSSVAKGLKLKVRKLLGLIPMFVGIRLQRKNWYGEAFCPPLSILNSVKVPNNIPINPPSCSFTLFLMVCLTPFINKPGSSNDSTIFKISFVSLLEINNIVAPDPNIFYE